MAAQRADDRQFAGTLTVKGCRPALPTWADSHCAHCGRETRELFGGWCIDCAGPVDYPWWCDGCNGYVHVDEARGGRCPDCGAALRRYEDAREEWE